MIKFLLYLILLVNLFCQIDQSPKLLFGVSLFNQNNRLQLNTFSIGGNVSGLNGTLIIQNNLTDNLTLNSNGRFRFSAELINNTNYSISVFTEPINSSCRIENRIGVVSSRNITNIDILCSNTTISQPELLQQPNPQPQNNLLNLTGEVLTLAGTNFCNPNSTCNGFALNGFNDSTNPTLAQFFKPSGITTDKTFLYVADNTNHRIRKIRISNGETSTLAGNGIADDIDATGILASIQSPDYLTAEGNFIYFTDNTNRGLRKIEISSGIVTTLISSSPNIPAPRGIIFHNNKLYILDSLINGLVSFDLSNSTFTTLLTVPAFTPRSIVQVGNDFYFTDFSNNSCIFKTTIGIWTSTQFAGCAVQGFQDGVGTNARFNNPTGITTDGTNLYVTDFANHAIRKVQISTAAVTTIAGSTTGVPGYINSSTSTNVRFEEPIGIVSDGKALYITDSLNHSIRILR